MELFATDKRSCYRATKAGLRQLYQNEGRRAASRSGPELWSGFRSPVIVPAHRGQLAKAQVPQLAMCGDGGEEVLPVKGIGDLPCQLAQQSQPLR